MSVRTSARSVCRIAAAAETVTVSVTWPTCSTLLTRITLSSATTRSVVTNSLKPERLTRTAYVPGGIDANVASPPLVVTALRVRLVPCCVIVTSAPGTAPPLGSRASTTIEP